jgi:hypothetical protein
MKSIKTQILELLYPENVPVGRVEHVAINVIPLVDKLIRQAELEPAENKVQLPQVVRAPPHVPGNIQNVIDKSGESADIVNPVENKQIFYDEEPEITITKTTFNRTEVDKLKFNFIQLSPVPEETDEWTKTTLKDVKYSKSPDGSEFIIRGKNNSRIPTTWDYLNDFFNSLPDVVRISNIENLGKHKAVTLCEFYKQHPNFDCDIEKYGYSNYIVKKEVTVNNITTTESRAWEAERNRYGIEVED